VSMSTAERVRRWRERHPVEYRVRKRDQYRKRVGGVRGYRCSRCDGFGHNTRSCSRPPDASES
jgi:hypothetical protein